MSDLGSAESGKAERIVEDTVSLDRASALAATLDLDSTGLEEGGSLPPAWHWIYFHTAAPRSEVAEDGHQLRGDFLPELELPRRMWAGGALRFPGMLRIGERARRVSRVRSVERKAGRSGPLVFVTVEHRIFGQEGVAVEEEQSLVYLDRRHRSPEQDDSARRTPLDQLPRADWSESFVADEVTLFRFSALTFNSHRIHYDQRYATEVEGYPGIVVHGPLIALLLMNAGAGHAEPGSDLSSFRYRALRPLFCNETVEVRGKVVDSDERGSDAESDLRASMLWAVHRERGVATEAHLTFRRGGVANR